MKCSQCAFILGVRGAVRQCGLPQSAHHDARINLLPADTFTAEAVRGQGVGWALIEVVYTQARNGGATRVYWQTHETNTTAMRLYDRVATKPGFVVYRHSL